jgi:GNAT superfamily N-acetyltransferase
MVFFIPKTGFITCRRSGRHSGEIVLVGIRKGLRGKGFGRALIEKAMTWFIKEKVTTVTERTQLKNLNAVNFYFRMGFSLREYDIIFGKIL